MINRLLPRLRRAVVVVCVGVGVGVPALTAAWGEDRFATALFLLVPVRLWYVAAVVSALVVAVCARGFARWFFVAPLVAVAASTSTGASLRDSRVTGPRIAAWNLAKGQIGTRQQLLDGLRGFDADVVCVSEAGVYDWLPGFDVDGLARELGYTAHGGGETRALSRLPVRALEELSLAPVPARRPLVVVDVDQDGERWRIGCVHLMPRLLLEDDSVDRGEAREGNWAVIFDVARRQSLALTEHLRRASLQRPIDLVIGDWNNQPFGRIVGDVKAAGYDDVFAGSGDVTLGDGLLGKRVDLALLHGRRWAKDAAICDVTGSDHKALVVEIGPWRGR